ncbi:MAG: hypothetical protein Q7R90_02925 [bacterium]|nr:hypothetical protein [bacterium]
MENTAITESVSKKEKLFVLADHYVNEQISFREAGDRDLPADAIELLETEWKKDTEREPSDPERPHWNEILITEYGNIRTHIASCDTNQSFGQIGRSSRHTYLVDMQGDDVLGYGAIYVENPQSPNEIKVGWTGTFDVKKTRTGKDFTRTGLNVRRLIVMNAYCLRHYQKPLHSSLAQLAFAEDAWKALVDAGFAEEVREEDRSFKSGKRQYRFK